MKQSNIAGSVHQRLLNIRDQTGEPFDVILRYMNIDDGLLKQAIRATFKRRKVPLPSAMPVAFTREFLEDGSKEKQWQAFLMRGALDSYDYSLAEAIADIRERIWPLIVETAAYQRTKGSR